MGLVLRDAEESHHEGDEDDATADTGETGEEAADQAADDVAPGGSLTGGLGHEQARW